MTNSERKEYPEKGKCGYIAHRTGLWDSLDGFSRKYLKSYSCTDGAWNFQWTMEFNGDNDRACNGDGNQTLNKNLDSKPSGSYLGWTLDANKDNTFKGYNNLADIP